MHKGNENGHSQMNIVRTKSYIKRLSNEVTVFKWITSCHKNRKTTRVMTLCHVHVTSLITSVSAMRFLNEIMFILKTVKSQI